MRAKTEYLIIGAGVMGLAIAKTLLEKHPSAKITVIEKEPHEAEHASGRNSGVLHAGFYYTADSLKAKFCREGNAAMKAFAKQHRLRINECGKVVVAEDEHEREMLHELKRRGDTNGVVLEWVDDAGLEKLEPYAKTHKEALFSPSTAVVDPREVCNFFVHHLRDNGVDILFSHAYQKRTDEKTILAGGKEITYGKLINCAGTYADRIAHDFGFCNDYTIIPFKGIYLVYQGKAPVTRCIYGVPNLKNPFLGVHFGMRVDGTVRLGPTAIPAFWRENYVGLERFNAGELANIAAWEMKLFAVNAFNFRSLAFDEMRKYNRSHMLALAGQISRNIDMSKFSHWDRPGIRSQLLNKKSLELLQDFVVESNDASIHVLNAVSPAFTCSLPFAKWVVGNYC